MSSIYDNDVLLHMIARLESELAAWPWSSTGSPFTVGVQQKEQPTQQGRNVEPTVFIEKLFDKPYGSAAVKYDTHTDVNLVSETETQVYTSTFQVSAACTQDPRNISLPTASDLCDIARMILQRRSAIRYFQAVGINLLRVADQIRNTYFTNEQDRQEAMPSFDLVVSFTRVTPAAELGRLYDGDLQIHRV